MYLIDYEGGYAAESACMRPNDNNDEAVEIEALIKQRNDARASKDWAAADAARDALTAMGVVLEDGAGGTTWRRS